MTLIISYHYDDDCYYSRTFQLHPVAFGTGNQTWFPEPRFDVAIGTGTKHVGTMTFNALEPWKYTLESLENEWNCDKLVASICGSSLATWFL